MVVGADLNFTVMSHKQYIEFHCDDLECNTTAIFQYSWAPGQVPYNVYKPDGWTKVEAWGVKYFCPACSEERGLSNI